MTKTFVYFKTEVDVDRGADVALRFSSGDAAIVDAPYGRGSVILITTSVDREWSTWAVWGHSLIPLMHETVNFAVSGRWKDRDVLVGQPLQCHVGLRATDAPAILHLPNGDTKQIQPSSDGRNVTSDPTATSGFHKIVLGPPSNRTDWFAVNVDTLESDLTALQSDDLRTELMPGLDFRYLTEWEEVTSEEGEPVRAISTGTGFSRSLLLAAMALLLVEQLMAWHFVAGVGLLLAFALSTLTWSTYRWDSWAGVALAVVIATSLVAMTLKLRPAIRSG